jgi:hypothetical protein
VAVDEFDLVVHRVVDSLAGEQPVEDIVEVVVHLSNAVAEDVLADGRSGKRQTGVFQIQRVFDIVRDGT